MLKKLDNQALCHHFYHWQHFNWGGGRGPGPLGYAYGLMITVQVCSHINYKICTEIEIPSFNTKKKYCKLKN